jgi:tetratricopeptide (TPR) repeat protein
VPGHVALHSWVNFGYNRSLCFEAAKEYLRDCCDYFLVADADHEIRVVDTSLTSMKQLRLTEACYTISELSPHGKGSLNTSTRLFRADLSWAYSGLTHEWPQRKDGSTCSGPRIEQIEYIHHKDGGNRSSKYQRDLDFLQRAVQDDPSDARSHFYLANTYRDLDDCTRAIPQYHLRIALGGWEQEVYMSWLSIARCLADDAVTQKLQAYSSALAVDPARPEAPYYMAQLHRLQYHDSQACVNFALFGQRVALAPEGSLWPDLEVCLLALRLFAQIEVVA